MKVPNFEELVRIIVWVLGAALTGSGWAKAQALLDMLQNEAVIGALVILLAAIWRLVRGATQDEAPA